MATYRELHGKPVKTVTTNPTDDAAEGQIWFNSTDNTFKSAVVAEAWASSATLPGNRTYGGGAGSQTAALAFAGSLNPPGAAQAGTFEYNGSGWSSGGDLPSVADLCGGLGTQSAGLKTFGRIGSPSTATTEAYEYDGSTWTATGNGSNARWGVGSAGTQTAGIAFGGFYNPPYTWFNNTERYDGSSWTNSGTLSTARSQVGFLGDAETSALCVGGETPPSFGATNAVEGYNGSSWSSETNYPAVSQGSAGVGSESDGLVFAPSPNSTNAFKYDGTTFTAAPSLGNGRQNGSRAGTTSAALAFQGNAGGGQNFTEEFTRSANIITAAAFASGTNLPVARGQGGGCGTQTAALQCGGIADSPASNTNTSFEYDGSSWAASPGSLNASTRNNSNFGIQTAAVTVGSLGPVTAAVDVYNGSSWTSGTSYPAPVSNIGVAGTTTAGVAWGGDQDPGYLTTTNEYNGSWTSSNAIPAARSNSACAGTQTAGLSVGGYVGSAAPSASVVATTIEYDGSSWTAGNNDLISRYNAGAAGLQTSALIFGGNTPSNTAVATLYDGTSFATQPSMGTARFLQTQGLGTTSTVALAAAGQTSTRVATVEEFTGETTSLNVKTLTQS